MRARPFNWLLIGLMVVAFAGRSWAQPVAVASMLGCGAVGTVAMDSANSTATHKAGEIAASETATQKHDSGKAKSADCVKCCAATQVLGLIAMAWSPDVWPQIHLAAVEVALHGQMPKPELVPPIALV